MKTAQQILTSCEKFHINLDLKRIKLVLALLDNPQNSFKSIHIAGTNGKGSTCKIINDVLVEHFKNTNKKVGLFTSPHLFSYTERIKINNTDISDYVFNRLVNDIDNFSKKHNIELTEFELLTVCAFYYFYIKKVDYAVIEVGLGGKYDATNVLNPILEVITTIDFDHTERLGDSISKIALQKAGIIKENSTVIVSKNNLGLDVIKKVAQNSSSKLIVVEPVDCEFSLKGDFQKENLSLALSALKNLDIKIQEETIKEALQKVKWKFRLDYNKEKNLLIDGGHNPSGIKALREYLDKNFKEDKKTFIFGCLKNKDYKKMLELLIRDEDEFYFYEFDYPNALKFDELDETIKSKAKKLSTKEEVINTINSTKNLKIACGSLYMLGNIFKDFIV